MMNEQKASREIHMIRAEIYEETKAMTPPERAAYANAQAQLLIKKYNSKVEYKNKTRGLAY